MSGREEWRIRYWARRYATCNLPYEDLVQEGRIAVWQGKSIRNAMRDAIRTQSRLIHIPAWLSDRRIFPTNAIPLAIEEDWSGDSEWVFENTDLLKRSKHSVSFLAAPDWIDPLHQRVICEEWLATLSPQEVSLLRALFWEQHTLAEIGKCLGVTEFCAAQRIMAILCRFRKRLGVKEKVSDELTRGEREILSFMAEGQDIDDMAARLGVSKSAVNTRLNGLYRKMGVRTLYKLYFEARRRGFIS